LLVLTALVALAHGLLLRGMPAVIQLAEGDAGPSDAGAATASFVTRTIAPPAARAQAVAPNPPPQPPPSPAAAARSAKPVAPAATTEPTATPPAAVEPTPVAPQESHATAMAAAPAEAAAQRAPEKGNSPSPATATDGPPPAAPPSGDNTAVAGKLNFAPAALLLYDGKGEERGFIKYAATAELAWLPDGKQYNARLEISAFGFRVRTWTSKGELTEAGLQPLRFGDKPRGAEQATHFQRDKGIISFSANNPDVPLQAGAQDKLSALLQLGALVAGEPARFSPGSTVRFQAADAHNAEIWSFGVGALEPLELPGGTLSTLKLTKEPTAEYGQRIEVWLAPELGYLPARLRITEANGAFADLLWRKTQKPK
jgi:hypothetical protein